ncbi:orotidine 5'-phosphate decarboxylase [Candidatus Giovannonibacteria bacterium RIFCSPHIGHO2_02_42_15]|uniref:Orotidine 5'-phosphate decarboxylase n=2 Tax=Candidatus Giovannoniibacteriota TaxID=1752738 RepID=A0A1F5VK10_9BACT|nr:MAG: Orotidine 5'-phosphate decarboxylase [Candidatus Giovannonibacteria bacterium GW2011_GWF2_42_19]OGF63803.1 MAG: orotidine 5'-phosphate decarboxylase [Candidatus Giovannonibacteria bacterium RIFCSPHIGHO2_02_42_15]
MKDPKQRIIYAADGPWSEEYHNLLNLTGEIGAVKLGMSMVTQSFLTGTQIFKTVLRETDVNVMIDLKFDDIPDQVASAAKAIAECGQDRILGFTVHASASRKVLQLALKVTDDNFKGQTKPLLMAVTLLTSLDQSDLDLLGIQGTPREVVVRWANIAKEEGVPAIVCSPLETSAVLEINPYFIVVNPGIRFEGSDLKNQKRVTTPRDAVAAGARYIVMGSDLRNGDMVANARRAAYEIGIGLERLKDDNYIKLTGKQS